MFDAILDLGTQDVLSQRVKCFKTSHFIMLIVILFIALHFDTLLSWLITVSKETETTFY